MWRVLEDKYKTFQGKHGAKKKIIQSILFPSGTEETVAVLFQGQSQEKQDLRISQARWRSRKLLDGFNE